MSESNATHLAKERDTASSSEASGIRKQGFRPWVHTCRGLPAHLKPPRTSKSPESLFSDFRRFRAAGLLGLRQSVIPPPNAPVVLYSLCG